MVGCSHSGIVRWESGSGAPSPQHAHAIADTLGQPVAEFTDVDVDQSLLRDLRVWAGLTQDAVRQELGAHLIGPMERGARPVPSALLPRLAELYGVDEKTLVAAAGRSQQMWRDRLEQKRRRPS
jgi:transcriptional regulator with XRE-family HTH domain